MKTTYFKMIAQKSTKEHTILIAVVPNDLLGKHLPEICEMEAFKLPSTIYTGTYPQIKINTDTIKSREDLIGLGVGGIITSPIWAVKEVKDKDMLGISIENENEVPNA